MIFKKQKKAGSFLRGENMRNLLICFIAFCGVANAQPEKQDYLIKFSKGTLNAAEIFSSLKSQGGKIEVLGVDNWARVQIPENKIDIEELKNNPMVESIQPNYKLHLLENYKIQDPIRRSALLKYVKAQKIPMADTTTAAKDNPGIPDAPSSSVKGDDPMFSKQWGMLDIGVKNAWNMIAGKKTTEIVVAVIDTGVDYTHEDLLPNMWRNTKEVPNNGVDDDNNGYVDDIVGWDFVSNDNKPYDLAATPLEILFKGGNPGHGTHCAGNVAAAGNNSKGVAGVAQNVKIMALRFIGEESGTTADAIKAIRYAVDNGARVLSNSWGSEGDDPNESAENQALKDAVQYAQDHDILFIAAAGNGHQGVGYDNDTDKAPGVPASYTHDNIISVAALDSSDQLGSFSNWGRTSVDIGAPGVKVFSTTVGSQYNDTVIDFAGIKATWDGTSMAAPHVAGAAALYLSMHPEKTFAQVKEAILNTAKPISAVNGKVVSNGKLNVEALMNY